MEKETKGTASSVSSADETTVKRSTASVIDEQADQEEVKTALADDASIYEKRDEAANPKEAWAELDRKGKWEFFKDYYLVKIAVTLAICGFLIYVGVVTLGPHTDKILYVAVLMDELDDDSVDSLTNDLAEVIETSKYKVISIDDSFNFSSDNSSFSGSDKLTTVLYSEIIDVIISDEDYFKQYSYYGYLMNLEEYLPEDILEAVSDRLLTANVEDDDDSDSAFDSAMGYTDEDDPYGDGTPYVFGIDLSGCEKYEALNPSVETPVLSIAYNAPNQENVYTFLRYLFSIEE